MTSPIQMSLLRPFTLVYNEEEIDADDPDYPKDEDILDSRIVRKFTNADYEYYRFNIIEITNPTEVVVRKSFVFRKAVDFLDNTAIHLNEDASLLLEIIDDLRKYLYHWVPLGDSKVEGSWKLIR